MRFPLLLCGALSFALVAGNSPIAGAEQSSGVKRALLIGINRYKSVPALQGSLNDVETMREILTTRWGFAPGNITMLTDEIATRDRLIAALNQLVQIAQPVDTVYFHYSGHGSQVEDVNGDETDGLDETIVPQDGRSIGVRDIVDDELDAIFSRLRAGSAVIVLDSCHSGTATRALEIRTRSVPQDTRLDLYRTGMPGTATRAIVPFKRSRYVVMGGAADNQEALDGPVDGRFHGFFTYALSRALMTTPVNASPREVFGGVTRELARIQTTYGRTSMPEPQLQAPPEALDRPLFASSLTDGLAATPDHAPRLAWIDAKQSADGQVILLNGLLLGAVPGSTWALYPRGDTRFAAGQALAVATVTQLVGNDARATLNSQRGPIPPESRAVALMPAPASTGISIRILNVSENQRGRIEHFLRRSIKGLTLAGPGQPARFLVDAQGLIFRLLTADGLRVVGSFAMDDERSAADVVRAASRSGKTAELLTLDNASSQLFINARVSGSEPVATRDIRLVTDTAPVQFHSRRQGEARSPQNSLQLNISVNADAYLTIVDVDSEGNMNVLFPNEYQQPAFYPEGAVRAGQQVLIPDSLQPGNRAGFYWDYSPPPGSDTVRVFATTDLAIAKTIRERVLALQQQDNLGSLRAELATVATRGITTVAGQRANELAAPPADWAATSVTIQVED